MFQNSLKFFLQPTLCSIKSVRNFTPRRALLYVPGDDLKKVCKSFLLDADCITLDCEDGVATYKKPQARENIRGILDKGKPATARKYDFCVRINPVHSELIKEDMKVILNAKTLPDTVFLPKVECPDDLILYLNKLVENDAKLGLILGIETACSLVNITDICRTAKKLSLCSKFKPEALLFGSDDYYASIGARKTESSLEILYARQKIVSVAKAFGLQAIDMVYIKYKDLEGLKRQAQEGARFGYSGKQVIHPGQIEITQNAFMPTDTEIDWATGIIKAFNEHQRDGQGAFNYEGSMIDMPTMKQAQNIIKLKELSK